jgi:hypothetical protein
MSPDEAKQLTDTIVTEVGNVATMVGVLDPELLPFIAIGKAVSKSFPGIVAGVANWIEGNPPTAEEKADFSQKLAVLSDPNAP